MASHPATGSHGRSAGTGGVAWAPPRINEALPKEGPPVAATIAANVPLASRAVYCCAATTTRDVHCLSAAAARDAADRRRLAGVAPRAEADVALVRAAAVGRVEADPAEAVDVQLGPGVRRLALRVLGEEIAGDVARRHARAMGERDQRVGHVLAHALAELERLGGGRVGRGRAGGVVDRLRDRRREPVRAVEPALVAALDRRLAELDEQPVRLGEGRGLQVDERLHQLAVAAEDAGGVGRLDDPLDEHLDPRRPVPGRSWC